jgi:hypothetical protein
MLRVMDALLMQLGRCISVGGGYVEKEMFFLGSNITCLLFISICDKFTGSRAKLKWRIFIFC